MEGIWANLNICSNSLQCPIIATTNESETTSELTTISRRTWSRKSSHIHPVNAYMNIEGKTLSDVDKNWLWNKQIDYRIQSDPHLVNNTLLILTVERDRTTTNSPAGLQTKKKNLPKFHANIHQNPSTHLMQTVKWRSPPPPAALPRLPAIHLSITTRLVNNNWILP